MKNSAEPGQASPSCRGPVATIAIRSAANGCWSWSTVGVSASSHVSQSSCLVAHAVRAADAQRELAGVLDFASDGGEQKRPRWNRRAMVLRIGQADEQAPPIVDQRHGAGEQPAAREVLRREAAPASSVFRFIDHVFRVSPVTVQLPERQDLIVQRSHQRAVFPKFLIRSDLGEAEQRLVWLWRSLIGRSRASLRCSRMMRRCRLQPCNRGVVSLSCHPWRT